MAQLPIPLALPVNLDDHAVTVDILRIVAISILTAVEVRHCNLLSLTKLL
jgi:hypothetical protein